MVSHLGLEARLGFLCREARVLACYSPVEGKGVPEPPPSGRRYCSAPNLANARLGAQPQL